MTKSNIKYRLTYEDLQWEGTITELIKHLKELLSHVKYDKSLKIEIEKLERGFKPIRRTETLFPAFFGCGSKSLRALKKKTPKRRRRRS